MLVGWGGNNGTTVTAGIISNREYAPPCMLAYPECRLDSRRAAGRAPGPAAETAREEA